MIPLKDYNPTRKFAILTFALLMINILVFIEDRLTGHYEQILVQTGHGAMAVNHFVGGLSERLALVPANLVAHPFMEWTTIFTSMFLHGGWLHVIVNMWALWIFGDNVEDHLGHFTYLLMYLLCGLAGGVTHTLLNLGSAVPSVGASGAIAGIMGAYFVLYPKARVLTLVPFFFVFFMWLPAWVVLGYWFVVQFLSGAATTLSATNPSGGGVAFWAHVGGFVSGLVLIRLFPSRPRRYRYGI